MTGYAPTPKVALITGAAGAIGLATARQLADQGMHLVLADVAPVDATASECANLKAESLSLVADVSSPGDIARMVAAALDRFGALHIVVNIAGVCPRTPFEDITPDEWDRTLAVNLRGPFLLIQAALPAMRAAGWGRIVNVASLAGQIGGIAVGAHYAASKAGLVALTKTVALLGAAHGITANAVAPGVIESDITRQASVAQRQTYLHSIPLGHIGEPQDVAAAVAFLCSDDARYITGATIDVNGGFLMR